MYEICIYMYTEYGETGYIYVYMKQEDGMRALSLSVCQGLGMYTILGKEGWYKKIYIKCWIINNKALKRLGYQ